tara:strand:- start:13 stop:972 length:960 start_codon:yes stop_codon:yes gene_type:complete
MNRVHHIWIASIVIFLTYGAFYDLFKPGQNGTEMFIAVVLVSAVMMYYITLSRQGQEFYIRPIPGIEAMEEAVGRSTEMGKPVLFVPGISDLNEVETMAGINILGKVAHMTATYETEINVPVARSIVMEACREVCKEAYLKARRPDLYNDQVVQYIADDQFAYTAAINGIMLREKPAACFYQGQFFAESLILAETGNSIGAIQIAGTGSSHQIPFFITACDYTLIGEEFLTASAILSGKKDLIGSIKGQDMIKYGIIILMILTSFHSFLSHYYNITFLSDLYNGLTNYPISFRDYWLYPVILSATLFISYILEDEQSDT